MHSRGETSDGKWRKTNSKPKNITEETNQNM